MVTKHTLLIKEGIEKKNKAILGALSMDLKRVALGYHRGSNVMAEKFFLKRL